MFLMLFEGMPQIKSYAKILTWKDRNMQKIEQAKESFDQQLYLDSIVRNMKLQSQIFQIDLVLNRLKIREGYLFNHLVYAFKNNLSSQIIYANELEQVRTLRSKIHKIKQQMKNFNIQIIAAKKHVRRLNS
jgi:division protein CdvB (Snf7/Vps24/ESCRT-III family)